MTDYDYTYNLFFNNNSRSKKKRPRRTRSCRGSGDKYIIVKHQGQHKTYRINKYGEVFEER